MIEEFVLETNIPIPPSRSSTRAPYIAWPFGDMRVGESFAIPREFENRISKAALWYATNHPGWYYIIRVFEGNVRLWRVKAEKQRNRKGG